MLPWFVEMDAVFDQATDTLSKALQSLRDQDGEVYTKVSGEWQSGVENAKTELLSKIDSAAADTQAALSQSILDAATAAKDYTDSNASAIRGDLEAAKNAAQAAASNAEQAAKDYADSVVASQIAATEKATTTAWQNALDAAANDFNKASEKVLVDSGAYTDDSIAAVNASLNKIAADSKTYTDNQVKSAQDDISKAYKSAIDAAIKNSENDLSKSISKSSTEAKAYTDKKIEAVEKAYKDADKDVEKAYANAVKVAKEDLDKDISKSLTDAKAHADKKIGAVEKAYKDADKDIDKAYKDAVKVALSDSKSYTDKKIEAVEKAFKDADKAAKDDLGKDMNNKIASLRSELQNLVEDAFEKHEADSHNLSCYGANNGNNNCHTCDDVVEAYKAKNWAYDTTKFHQCMNDDKYSCYGAKATNDCKSCHEVMEAYKAKGWLFNNMNFLQCQLSCYGAKSIDDCKTCDDVVNAYKAKNWKFDKSAFHQCKGLKQVEDESQEVFEFATASAGDDEAGLLPCEDVGSAAAALPMFDTADVEMELFMEAADYSADWQEL